MAVRVEITDGFGRVSRLRGEGLMELFPGEAEANTAAQRSVREGAVQAEVSVLNARSGEFELKSRYQRGETGRAVKTWPTSLPEKEKKR